MTYIYEIIDASNDEEWFPMGVWLTEDEARAALQDGKDPEAFFHVEDNEYASLKLIRRELGWSGFVHETLAKRAWKKEYQEPTDTYAWIELEQP